MGPPPDLKLASDQDVVTSALEGLPSGVWRAPAPIRASRPGALIYRIVPHRERAEDLKQETFDKAFTALDRYRRERRFAPWILRIANNTAVDYLRCKRFDSWDSPFLDTPGHIDASAIGPPTLSDTARPTPRAASSPPRSNRP